MIEEIVEDLIEMIELRLAKKHRIELEVSELDEIRYVLDNLLSVYEER